MSLEHSTTLKNGDPNLEYFLRFVNELKENGIKIFKYEDFCSNPDKFMIDFCEYTGLTYDESYKNYKNFTTFNGDIFSENSRGLKKDNIFKIERRNASEDEIRFLENNTRMKDVNKMLEYPCHY